jgi:dihydrofolate reductase
LLAGYVRYCPGGSLHFIAYSPKLVEVLHFRKFADAKECVTGILSLPNVGWDMDSEEAPMRKVIASEIVSLDGVVESPQEWHFPYFNDQMGDAIGAAMAASDAMLLGRVTYEEFAAFWPSQEPSEEDQETTDYMNNTPKFVVSKTLEEPLEWQNSTLIKGDVAEEISKLKGQPGKDISITGSPTLVRSLLEEDLLDELRLMLHPIVVGSGKRLFEEGSDQKALQLVDSKTFSTGVLYLTYQPAQR